MSKDVPWMPNGGPEGQWSKEIVVFDATATNWSGAACMWECSCKDILTRIRVAFPTAIVRLGKEPFLKARAVIMPFEPDWLVEDEALGDRYAIAVVDGMLVAFIYLW